MHDDFTFKVCELDRKHSLEEVKGRLQISSALPGTYSPLGVRGGRFVPDNLMWPAIYFSPDGRTLEVVTKDLDMTEVDDFLCRLAQTLGCRIFSETLEYS